MHKLVRGIDDSLLARWFFGYFCDFTHKCVNEGREDLVENIREAMRK